MTKKQIIKQEIFHFLFILFIIFVLLEIIWPNIVIAYFNLNILLIICLLSALSLLIKK